MNDNFGIWRVNMLKMCLRLTWSLFCT